jgi:hypothetical protein
MMEGGHRKVRAVAEHAAVFVRLHLVSCLRWAELGEHEKQMLPPQVHSGRHLSGTPGEDRDDHSAA